MIKARSGDLILLGLSRGNLEQLLAHKPILFDAAAVGLPGQRISIIFGETESAILRELADAGCELPPGLIEDAERIEVRRG